MLDGSPAHGDEANIGNIGNVENNNPVMLIPGGDGLNAGSKPLLKKGGRKLRPVICLSDHNNNTVPAASPVPVPSLLPAHTVLSLHHLKQGAKKELLKSKGGRLEREAAQPGGQTARNLPRHDQVTQNVNTRSLKPKHGQSPGASHPAMRDNSSPNKPPSLHHPPLREKKKPLHASNKMKILRTSPVETSPEYLKDGESLCWSEVQRAALTKCLTQTAQSLGRRKQASAEQPKPRANDCSPKIAAEGSGFKPWEPRSGPGTRQDTTDPEDEVSYASVSFTKTNRKVQLQNNDDEGETVTYSSVKVSSASARASTDPRRLYAAVNKRQK
ncbi:hypothetical protein Q5P01_004644 [Channa striata]|uniref:Uncharacterized protein n=1 Tax=Channa striata TaxID=64152 RepID=A0AA88SYN9_CHASR|nr:hypothetical protein Q5P01_004644 [Channa striata]